MKFYKNGIIIRLQEDINECIKKMTEIVIMVLKNTNFKRVVLFLFNNVIYFNLLVGF